MVVTSSNVVSVLLNTQTLPTDPLSFSYPPIYMQAGGIEKEREEEEEKNNQIYRFFVFLDGVAFSELLDFLTFSNSFCICSPGVPG